TKDGRMMGRGYPGVGIECKDCLRARVGRNDMPVLRDRTHRPLVKRAGLPVEPFSLDKLPGIAPVSRSIDAPDQLAILNHGWDRAVQNSFAALIIGASGKVEDPARGQARPLRLPVFASVARTPDSFCSCRKHRMWLTGRAAIEEKGQRIALWSRALRPGRS